MKVLVTTDNYIIGTATESITFGLFENDPNHKWALDGGRNGYIIDGNIMATNVSDTIYTIHEVDEIPEGYWKGQYFFENGEFIENTDWVEFIPPKSDAERITELETIVAKQKLQLQQADDTAIELFEAQLAQEEINQAQDDALIELWEMVEQQGGGE